MRKKFFSYVAGSAACAALILLSGCQQTTNQLSDITRYVEEKIAEGKGTEKNLSEAFFWYERAMRRGQTRMEDPAKDLSDEEKEALLSSEQKFILELDDEVKAYERYRAEGDAEDVDLSDL